MDSKMNIWDKQQQNWIKEILSKSGTELKEISDKNGKCVISKEKKKVWFLKNFESKSSDFNIKKIPKKKS